MFSPCTVVLKHESADDFRALLEACYSALQPRDRVECGLVGGLVATRWRLRRASSMLPDGPRALADLRANRKLQEEPNPANEHPHLWAPKAVGERRGAGDELE
jgi:hypothetical protein